MIKHNIGYIYIANYIRNYRYFSAANYAGDIGLLEVEFNGYMEVLFIGQRPAFWKRSVDATLNKDIDI